MENLNALVDAALAEVEQAGDIRALDDVRVKYGARRGNQCPDEGAGQVERGRAPQGRGGHQ